MPNRKNEHILELLSQLPWWVSVTVGVTFFIIIRFGIPMMASMNSILKAMAPAAPQLSWIAIVFLLPAAASLFEQFRKAKLLDSQRSIETIRSLSWREFEELLAEYYRRQGFSVKENTSMGPDGGVDIGLEKNGQLYLVQCKQWKATKVGVNIVREMLGLVTAHNAAGGFIVTSGSFTQDAKSFAEGKSLELIDGKKLSSMILVPVGDGPQQVNKPSSLDDICPKCGKKLVVREARRGANAGNRFYGCSGYPNCRFTKEYSG